MVKKRVGLLILNDDLNHIKFVTDVLSQTLGYHPTQAFQCANLIDKRGSYIVKEFEQKDKHKAELYRNILINAGLTTKIIPL